MPPLVRSAHGNARALTLGPSLKHTWRQTFREAKQVIPTNPSAAPETVADRYLNALAEHGASWLF